MFFGSFIRIPTELPPGAIYSILLLRRLLAGNEADTARESYEIAGCEEVVRWEGSQETPKELEDQPTTIRMRMAGRKIKIGCTRYLTFAQDACISW